jgi:hypothetical protein
LFKNPSESDIFAHRFGNFWPLQNSEKCIPLAEFAQRNMVIKQVYSISSISLRFLIWRFERRAERLKKEIRIEGKANRKNDKKSRAIYPADSEVFTAKGAVNNRYPAF